MIYKQPPYIPPFRDGQPFTSQDSLVPEDMEHLRAWGLNLVRLGVMWEAVETSEGTYNQTYLDEVEKLINQLGEYGIYTMVDMHQDVMSRIICGEGMPAFYATQVSADATCSGDWS